MPSFIHIDKGAETSTPATMYCFVCRQYRDVETDEEAVKSVIYGQLTSNEVVFLNVAGMYVWC